MITQWLTHENIYVVDSVDNWQEAIALSAKPLLKKNCISPSYIEAILASHEELGPYYVIAPGLALPHARPEQGALKNGLSLLRIIKGVCFNSAENDPVYLVIMLSAVSSEQHIVLVSLLAEIFSDENKLNRLLNAPSLEIVYQIINGSGDE